LHWHTATATHIGGRGEQQDRSVVLSSPNGKESLIVIADGMGGLEGGSRAAQAVIDASQEVFDSTPEPDAFVFLKRIIDRAHQFINQLNGLGNKAPGSTCVILLLREDGAYWAHVGDSRLYHFRNRKVLEKTSDHSVVQMLIQKGSLTELEAAASPLQNQIYKRLGGMNLPDPDFGTCSFLQGDVFLLCTDGFWSAIEPEETIENITNNLLAESVESLVLLAAEQGGVDGDNIAVALAAIE